MKTIATITALLCSLLSISAYTEQDILVATIILEAGGEYTNGSLEAVHEVIINRSLKRRMTPMDVCLQRMQFSCWNSGKITALMQHAKRHPRWGEVMAITQRPLTNYTSGADHYHADYCNPYWAKSLTRTTKIGRHIFYK